MAAATRLRADQVPCLVRVHFQTSGHIRAKSVYLLIADIDPPTSSGQSGHRPLPDDNRRRKHKAAAINHFRFSKALRSRCSAFPCRWLPCPAIENIAPADSPARSTAALCFNRASATRDGCVPYAGDSTSPSPSPHGLWPAPVPPRLAGRPGTSFPIKI